MQYTNTIQILIILLIFKSIKETFHFTEKFANTMNKYSHKILNECRWSPHACTHVFGVIQMIYALYCKSK